MVGSDIREQDIPGKHVEADFESGETWPITREGMSGSLAMQELRDLLRERSARLSQGSLFKVQLQRPCSTPRAKPDLTESKNHCG